MNDDETVSHLYACNMSYVDELDRKGIRHRRIALALVSGLFALLIVGFLWATSTPGESFAGSSAKPKDGALAGQLENHVRSLSGKPRNLQVIASITRTTGYLQAELSSYGYTVERQSVLDPADNLIVRLKAKQADAPVLVIGAHYDSFGAAPGADDNASGVAALLELARRLKSRDGRLEQNLVLVFFANEEPPYFKSNAMGSLVHAPSLSDDKPVIGVISLESIGYFSDEEGSQHYPFPLSLRYPGTGNFIAFVGDLSSREFLRETIGEFRAHARIPSVGGTAPGFVQGIDWSDHWGYSLQGIPAIMVTDTAPFRNPNYHKRSDTPETLDYQRLALVVEGLEGMLVY